MPVYEYAANMHMHTPYSDGEWYHARIAEAAIGAGLDLICVTDHNVWVKGPERYYEQDGRRVLLLVGEEVHDQTRDPQKNHLLVYGADKELAPLAPRPQKLLEAAARAGSARAPATARWCRSICSNRKAWCSTPKSGWT